MRRLRFFADHCISPAIMDALRAIGAEVLRLREHCPIDAPDEVVIATAQQLGAIFVSLNGDFANIVTYPPARYHGIIALQVHNHSEMIPQLMARLTDYLFRGYFQLCTHERCGMVSRRCGRPLDEGATASATKLVLAGLDVGL